MFGQTKLSEKYHEILIRRIVGLINAAKNGLEGKKNEKGIKFCSFFFSFQ
jgi:hypothetical protein